MSDLISRQAAIDSIERHLRFGDELYPLTDTDKVLNHGFEIAASCVYNLPSAQSEGWMERNEERILKAGMEGREIEFRIGGRLFAIREKAQ